MTTKSLPDLNQASLAALAKLKPPVQRRRRSIRIRLIVTATTVALITTTVLGISWLAERNARRALTSELETRLLLEARNLAFVSADALLSEYPELILYPVVSEMQNERPDLAFVVVVDRDGTIQGHVDARLLGTKFHQLEAYRPISIPRELRPGESILGNGEMLVASVPVVHGQNRVLGTALVGLRRAYLRSLLRQSHQELTLFTTILLAVGILGAMILMSLLLRPIDSLREGLKRIGSGDLDTPIRVQGHTELGMLAETVNDVAAELKITQQEILASQIEIIHTLGNVVESRSFETGAHTKRVGEYSGILARLAGLSEEEAELVQMAAPMHDVGKIGIPDSVLNKPGKLTPEEIKLMQTHTIIGYGIFSKSKRPFSQAAALIAYQHHEKWDGSGYPRGLSGHDIHVYGRIVGLVDVFDAISTHRVYRKAMDMEEALGIMREGRGKHFDPELVDLFFAHFDQFLDVYTRHFPHAKPPEVQEAGSVAAVGEAVHV